MVRERLCKPTIFRITNRDFGFWEGKNTRGNCQHHLLNWKTVSVVTLRADSRDRIGFSGLMLFLQKKNVIPLKMAVAYHVTVLTADCSSAHIFVLVNKQNTPFTVA